MRDTADPRQSPGGSEDRHGDTERPELHAEVTTLIEELSDLEELEAITDSPEAQKQVQEAMDAAHDVRERTRLQRFVSGFDRSDAAESLLGSLLLGIPMAVEGGTAEVAEFLSARPPLLLATLLGTLVIVSGVLFVADIRDVRIRNPLVGVVPRRLLGVVSVSFLTALFLLTGWGRVSWADPLLALSNVAVAFVPMSIGAALGDLLPEE
jgi:uncharacterized membrane protein